LLPWQWCCPKNETIVTTALACPPCTDERQCICLTICLWWYHALLMVWT
jgi:hypothetical protein